MANASTENPDLKKIHYGFWFFMFLGGQLYFQKLHILRVFNATKFIR